LSKEPERVGLLYGAPFPPEDYRSTANVIARQLVRQIVLARQLAQEEQYYPSSVIVHAQTALVLALALTVLASAEATQNVFVIVILMIATVIKY